MASLPQAIPSCPQPPVASVPPAYRIRDPSLDITYEPIRNHSYDQRSSIKNPLKSESETADLEAQTSATTGEPAARRIGILQKVKKRLSRVALKWWFVLVLVVAVLMVIGVGVGAMAIRKAVNGGSGRHGLIVG